MNCEGPVRQERETRYCRGNCGGQSGLDYAEKQNDCSAEEFLTFEIPNKKANIVDTTTKIAVTRELG